MIALLLLTLALMVILWTSSKISRSRVGGRNVRAHHRALGTLASITCEESGRAEIDVTQAQLHVRLVEHQRRAPGTDVDPGVEAHAYPEPEPGAGEEERDRSQPKAPRRGRRASGWWGRQRTRRAGTRRAGTRRAGYRRQVGVDTPPPTVSGVVAMPVIPRSPVLPGDTETVVMDRSRVWEPGASEYGASTSALPRPGSGPPGSGRAGMSAPVPASGLPSGALVALRRFGPVERTSRRSRRRSPRSVR